MNGLLHTSPLPVYGHGFKEFSVTIPAWAVERWQRQMVTPYAKLSKAEKNSDRLEADKMIVIALAGLAKKTHYEGTDHD